MAGNALILGASGRFGRAMAEALRAAGWTVRGFDRRSGDLHAAARGADIIVHGWNPPYTRWVRDMPRQTAEIIAAAKASGATVLVPGNVYVYGDQAPLALTETTPHAAKNPLGRARIDMERRFAESGVRTILLRAGDFIDTRASGNWFDMVIAAGLPKGKLASPGDPDAPHAWAYLPDFARAFVELAERRERLPRYCALNFEGYTLSTREMATLLGARLRRFNWLPVQILSPVWPMGRRLLEMRYLWSMPHRLDGSAFRALLPDFHATPVAEALARATSLDIDPDEVMVGGAAPAGAE